MVQIITGVVDASVQIGADEISKTIIESLANTHFVKHFREFVSGPEYKQAAWLSGAVFCSHCRQAMTLTRCFSPQLDREPEVTDSDARLQVHFLDAEVSQRVQHKIQALYSTSGMLGCMLQPALWLLCNCPATIQ